MCSLQCWSLSRNCNTICISIRSLHTRVSRFKVPLWLFFYFFSGFVKMSKWMQTTADIGTSGVNGRKFQSSFNPGLHLPSCHVLHDQSVLYTFFACLLFLASCKAQTALFFSRLFSLSHAAFFGKAEFMMTTSSRCAHMHFICHCWWVSRSRSMYFGHRNKPDQLTSL